MSITLHDAADSSAEEPARPHRGRRHRRGDAAAQARLVGLREFATPTLEAVERRRVQLWLLSIAMIAGITVIIAAGLVFPESILDRGAGSAWFSGSAFRALLLLLAAGFALYVFDKERHLRRLTRLLVDERVLTTGLTTRLAEATTLLEAGKALNSILELDVVLDVILDGATGLLDAAGGSIMLADPDRPVLRVVCDSGNVNAVGEEVPFGEGIAGRVARNGEPALVSGDAGTGRVHPVESAMCVPLVHRGDHLGVLNVNAPAGREFSEYDLRALSLFAEQAAAAIGNARLFEAERRHVAELIEAETRTSEFLAGVSHDLRTPLTGLTACAKLLKREDLSPAQRSELTTVVERQTARLTEMVESLLAAAKLDPAQPPRLEPVDLAPLLQELHGEYHFAGRPFVLYTPPSALVLGQVEGVRRIFTNLLDNACKHGGAPIAVTVRTGEQREVVVDVRDHGPGIPDVDRDRVFGRFTRLDTDPTVPGMGLGLSIVHGLAGLYGGSIEVADPESGPGTVMRLRLRPAPVALPSMEAERHI